MAPAAFSRELRRNGEGCVSKSPTGDSCVCDDEGFLSSIKRASLLVAIADTAVSETKLPVNIFKSKLVVCNDPTLPPLSLPAPQPLLPTRAFVNRLPIKSAGGKSPEKENDNFQLDLNYRKLKPRKEKKVVINPVQMRVKSKII